MNTFLNIASKSDNQQPLHITLHHSPVLNAINKFRNYQSILKIKKQVLSDAAFPFSFRKVTLNDIINKIKKNLDESKAT